MHQPVIHTENLQKKYRMGAVEVAALRGISVDIYPGELVAIMALPARGSPP